MVELPNIIHHSRLAHSATQIWYQPPPTVVATQVIYFLDLRLALAVVLRCFGSTGGSESESSDIASASSRVRLPKDSAKLVLPLSDQRECVKAFVSSKEVTRCYTGYLPLPLDSVVVRLAPDADA